MRNRKERNAGEQKLQKNELRCDFETESNVSKSKRWSKFISNLMSLFLQYFINAVKFIFHYIFDPRLNTVKELYPYHANGEYEPKSKYGYRFFLVSNRVQNLGFGFEYKGVYYFSNAHFKANTDSLNIDGKEIRLHQQGFTLLCSKKVHNLKKPIDDEDLYLLNPYMPTIKGKCIYKHPFYYSFFPTNSICRELTGLPITNSRGELVSIYDSFRKMEDLVYNIIGDVNLWNSEQNKTGLSCKVESIVTCQRDLQVFKVSSDFGDENNNRNIDRLIGYFFNYKSITYISGAFVEDFGELSLPIPLEYSNIVKKSVTYSNLFRDLWISEANSKHNLGLPEHNEEAFVLNITGDIQQEIKGKIKLNKKQQFWVKFDGVPNRKCLGLPILNNNNQLIGVYSEFNIENNYRKLKYSIYLGGPNIFKNYFFRMSLNNSKIRVLKVNYDIEIIEQVVSLISLGIQNDQEDCNKLVNRVIFGVGSEEISHKIFNDINLVLNKYQNLSSCLDNLISVANNSTVKYTQVQDKKFIIANIDWIGYTYLNSDNSFPFNSSKSLLILLSHRSSHATEELLDSYFKSTHKSKRGYYLKLASNY